MKKASGRVMAVVEMFSHKESCRNIRIYNIRGQKPETDVIYSTPQKRFLVARAYCLCINIIKGASGIYEKACKRNIMPDNCALIAPVCLSITDLFKNSP